MPAVTSGKVLVTGANGYIAVWVVKSFLDAGFAVRGTVRSESKAGHLRNLFKSFGDKFEVVIVEDITKEGAFDAYVKDVDAIAYTASPFHMKAVEPDDMIVPAVQGTLGILKSARAHGTSVRRVVITSSTAALFSSNPDPSRTRLLSEADWNDEEVAQCREKGRDATALAKYRASKTLAERAAWAFVEEHKQELGWDLVALNPPYVFGPAIHEVDKPENLNESARDWYLNVVKGRLDNEALATMGASYVDVRDIAQAHVLALLKPEAAGNRFICSARSFKWQDFVSAAHRAIDSIPAGNTSYDPSQAKQVLAYDNRKAIAILGIKFRSLEETTKDTVEDFKVRGWL
ncbi:NAD-P-binding protein [Cubamyces sp. BRFM 1775]|nr:NAD-P-binding protein [Cubamyces sp. BRFM 1775]